MFARNIILEHGSAVAYDGERGEKDADVYRRVATYKNGAMYTLTRYTGGKTCSNLQLPVSALTSDGRYLFCLACFPESKNGGAEQFLNEIYAVLSFLVPDFETFYLNIPTFGTLAMTNKREGVNGSS